MGVGVISRERGTQNQKSNWASQFTSGGMGARGRELSALGQTLVQRRQKQRDSTSVNSKNPGSSHGLLTLLQPLEAGGST